MYSRMNGKGSKAKGSDWERKVCVLLSEWVSHGAQRDCFWRSAMSGGRATVAAAKNGDKLLRRQAGDITATAPEGHPLTDLYYIEAKAYRDLELTAFILGGKGVLAGFWSVIQEEAKRYGKLPMLICKQNLRDPFVLMSSDDNRADGCWLAQGRGWKLILLKDLLDIRWSTNDESEDPLRRAARRIPAQDARQQTTRGGRRTA